LALAGTEELRQPDRATGTRRVFKLEVFDDFFRAHDLFNGARRLIPTATRRGWNEDIEFCKRLRERRRDPQSYERGDADASKQETTAVEHGYSPYKKRPFIRPVFPMPAFNEDATLPSNHCSFCAPDIRPHRR
jgi:hypothetical protein